MAQGDFDNDNILYGQTMYLSIITNISESI